MRFVETDLQGHVFFGNYLIIPFEFSVYRKANDELVATAKIVAITVDPETKRPKRVPDGFREAVAHYEAE